MFLGEEAGLEPFDPQKRPEDRLALRIYTTYRLCRLFGCTPDQLAELSTSWFDALAACDAAERDAFLEQLNAILKSGEEAEVKMHRILIRLCAFLAVRL